MLNRILILAFSVGSAAMLAGPIVQLTLVPGGPAAPGSDFSWSATLENNTQDYLNPTLLESTFPDPIVFDNFTAFYNTFPNGLPGGQSATLSLGYHVPADAVPGSQIGNPSGPCCVFQVDYDLYADAEGTQYDGSSSVLSGFTAVQVAGGESTPPVTPEPATWMSAAAGLLLTAVFGKRRNRSRNVECATKLP